MAQYKSSSGRKKTTKNTSTSKKNSKRRTKQEYALLRDIQAIVAVALGVFLFICNFNIAGSLGSAISGFLFGVFGLLNYVAPLFVVALFLYYQLAGGSCNSVCVKNVISLSLLFLLIDMIVDLISGISKTIDKYSLAEIYRYSSTERKGGGVIAGSLDYVLLKAVNMAGTVIIISMLILVLLIVLTGKSVIDGIRESSQNIKENADANREIKAELYNDRKLEIQKRREEERLKREELRAQQKEAREKENLDKKEIKSDEAVLKRNKKAVGVTFNTTLPDNTKKVNVDLTSKSDDIHEINLNGFTPSTLEFTSSNTSDTKVVTEAEDADIFAEEDIAPVINASPDIGFSKEESAGARALNPAPASMPKAAEAQPVIVNKPVSSSAYVFPPRTLLKKGEKKSSSSKAYIEQTARKLEETLSIFGVDATVTNTSQGPTVTRYELQPKIGTKVSRIKNLSDDIKLNLAASEIRIEAPIPGKAAIGIEVPNKEAEPVLFRDLIDTDEYNKFNSNLAFAVGKDIAGKTIVYGIDNFPHLLIAGATGSGKSVCINTLIMSILYKAKPDDVKLVMIDPKVVELSVYNGIPHLLLPVVTDVKKASATLAYAVNEMHERYKKFADFGARDISGYNKIVTEKGEDQLYPKLPHIVIIVDEVADLMLQERKNVEDSICSLAQLARAAGIHLIIATQRPSVDVITGLIKANMPSRIAFAVSSGVDSRTILDMVGAEELLGKGDMLFFPKGLKKPVRLQGGFVSDKEVSDVVDFIKAQGIASYDDDIEAKIQTCSSSGSAQGAQSGDAAGGDGNDELFRDAGFFIIESNKASIGWLQRKFKIGFNRAARVMDQLADANVVGPDAGTKPREILMSREQFENYLEEYGG